MTGLPRVTTALGNGNLGKVQASEDGIALLIVSGVAVSGKFALGDVQGPFTSLKDAEDNGITAAYDSTNTCLAHQHIADFYSEAGNGAKLYVMVAAKTVLMALMADKTSTWAKTALSGASRGIKLVGITRVPDGAYTATYSGQLDPDVVNAITAAKALRADEFDDPNKRPVHFFIEGRDFQGTVSTLTDLRASGGPAANRVSVVLGNDATVAASVAYKADYASVGAVLGRYAKIAVQRSAGRVRDGVMVSITNAGFSGGYSYGTYTPTQLNTVHDKGYIFFRTIAGKSGYFINGDCVACELTDDYSLVPLGRVIDKASRMADIFLADYINDDLDIDATTGLLPVSVCKQIEGDLKSYVQTAMAGEISSVGVYVDPDQNLLTTSKITVQIFIQPKGYSQYLEALTRFIDLSTESMPQ